MKLDWSCQRKTVALRIRDPVVVHMQVQAVVACFARDSAHYRILRRTVIPQKNQLAFVILPCRTAEVVSALGAPRSAFSLAPH